MPITEEFLNLTKHDPTKNLSFSGKEMYDDGSCWRYIANQKLLFWDAGLRTGVLIEAKDNELDQVMKDYKIYLEYK
jgi:hypothetical protein